MLTLEELLALLAQTDLTDDERTSIAAALADLSQFDGETDLDQIAEALLARANTILDATLSADPVVAPSDDQLAELDYIATASEAVTAEIDARAEGDAEAVARAQALAERIRGEADGDDGEPASTDGDDADGADADADGADADGDDADGEGDGEPADAQAEPVAASGTRVSRVAARRPRSAQPRPQAERQVAALTASANVPGATMGQRLDTPERLGLAFASTLEAMGNMVLRDGMRVPIASARVEFPAEAMLSLHDVRHNERLIQGVTAPQAVAASGGICAPAVPRYDLPQVAVADRPVRDALVRFGSDRGGSIIPAPLLLDDLDGSSTLWTQLMDQSAAQNPSVRKPCLRLTCGDDTTVVPYGIVKCLEIGNWNARTWPERVDRFVSLAAAWQARYAESRLLTRIGELSTSVTVAQALGATRDTLNAVGRAAAAMRDRHRMGDTVPLRWMAPATLRAEIREDLAREMPGSTAERLATSDAEIDTFFSVRNINVTWFLDGEAGQVFPAQADGTLRGWHPNVISYLFPEGTFIFLDGGELDLGVVRDSTLNAKNDFQMFSEMWEEVAFVGVESLRITHALCPDGSASGTVEPACADLATS